MVSSLRHSDQPRDVLQGCSVPTQGKGRRSASARPADKRVRRGPRLVPILFLLCFAPGCTPEARREPSADSTSVDRAEWLADALRRRDRAGVDAALDWLERATPSEIERSIRALTLEGEAGLEKPIEWFDPESPMGVLIARRLGRRLVRPLLHATARAEDPRVAAVRASAEGTIQPQAESGMWRAMGSEGLDELILCATDPTETESVRVAALARVPVTGRHLGWESTRALILLVLGRSGSSSPVVMSDAARLLASGFASVEAIAACLGDRDADVRAGAVEIAVATGIDGRDELRSGMAAAVSDSDLRVRVRALPWLLLRPESYRQAQAVVEALLRDDIEGDVRLAAALVLARQWPGDDAWRRGLLMALRSDRDTRVRAAAIEAMR